MTARPIVLSSVLVLSPAVLCADINAQVTEDFQLRVLVVSETGEPVKDAFVELIDSQAHVAARAFAGDSAVARIKVPGPGEYIFSVQRFGYEAWTSYPMRLDSRTSTIELRVRVEPVRLNAIGVDVDGRCSPDPAPLLVRGFVGIGRALGRVVGIRPDPTLQGGARGRIMERAHHHASRTLSAVITARPPQVSYSMRTITKGPRFAADTDSVLQVVDTGYVRTGIALSTPSPEWLARNGFILPRTSSEELPKYFAPTPEVLISEPFTSTHCFRGMQHPDSSWLGLAFEPAKGIVMPDVRGVVWVDTLRSRPVRIEYHYTRLAEFLDKHERRYARRPGETDREYQRGIEREQTWVTEKVAVPGTRIFAPDPKEDEFGGIIEFEQTHDRWDISRWEIRWPSLRYRSRYAFSEPVPGQGIVNGRTVVRRYVVNIWFHILLHWNVAEIVQE